MLITTTLEVQAETALQYVSYIWYLVQFQERLAETQALIDSDSEFNAIISAYTVKLGFITQKTDVGTRKIYCLTLENYGIV